MRFFSSQFALTLTAVISVAANGSKGIAQDNGLFSSVRASTVFSETAVAGSEPAPQSSSNGRTQSASELVGWLQSAGFTASPVGDRAASTVKQLDSWRFPVLVTISEDEQDLLVVIGLRNISEPQKLSAAKLLSLLEANQKTGRASLVFSSERRRIELQTVLANGSTSSGLEKHSDVRDEINRLAILARDKEAVWNLEEIHGGASLPVTVASETQAFRSALAPQGAVATSPGAGPGSLPVAPNAPTSAAPATIPPALPPATLPVHSGTPGIEVSLNSLQGRWAASRSATEAFAMQINGDSTFILVSVISGKQARSSGKLTLLNGQLTLEGSDGIRIAGAVTLASYSELQFSPQSTSGAATVLSFRKAP